jgi:hypothetical protein
MVAGRKWLPIDTGYLMRFGMIFVVSNPVDSRMRNLISRLKFISYVCHF